VSVARRTRAVVAVGLLLIAVAPASARSVTDAQLRELATTAGSSASARRTLSEVTEVDARRVDVGPALVDDTYREARLRVLEAPAIEVETRRLAERAQVLRAPKRAASESSPDWNPFSGRGFGWLALSVSLAIIGVAFVAGIFISRRRGAAVHSRRATESLPPSPGVDPDDLERRAAEAEQVGDGRAAIRLRFQAGLIRLGRSGMLTYRPSLTTREASEQLDSPLFAPLAGTFEEVTYGGRDATPDDVRIARETWPTLTGRRG
jgi:Domain of unknown function (DUF4129)